MEFKGISKDMMKGFAPDLEPIYQSGAFLAQLEKDYSLLLQSDPNSQLKTLIEQSNAPGVLAQMHVLSDSSLLLAPLIQTDAAHYDFNLHAYTNALYPVAYAPDQINPSLLINPENLPNEIVGKMEQDTLLSFYGEEGPIDYDRNTPSEVLNVSPKGDSVNPLAGTVPEIEISTSAIGKAMGIYIHPSPFVPFPFENIRFIEETTGENFIIRTGNDINFFGVGTQVTPVAITIQPQEITVKAVDLINFVGDDLNDTATDNIIAAAGNIVGNGVTYQITSFDFLNSPDPFLFLSATQQIMQGDGLHEIFTIATTIFPPFGTVFTGDIGILDVNLSNGQYTYTIPNTNAESLFENEVIVFNFSIGAFNSTTGTSFGIPDASATLTIFTQADSVVLDGSNVYFEDVEDDLGSQGIMFNGTNNFIVDSVPLSAVSTFSLSISPTLDPSSSPDLFILSIVPNGPNDVIVTIASHALASNDSGILGTFSVNVNPSDLNFGQYTNFVIDPTNGNAESLTQIETAGVVYIIGNGFDMDDPNDFATGLLNITFNADALSLTDDTLTNTVGDDPGDTTAPGNFLIDSGLIAAGNAIFVINTTLNNTSSAGLSISDIAFPIEFDGTHEVLTVSITSPTLNGVIGTLDIDLGFVAANLYNYTFTIDPVNGIADQLPNDIIVVFDFQFVADLFDQDNPNDVAPGTLAITVESDQPSVLAANLTNFVGDDLGDTATGNFITDSGNIQGNNGVSYELTSLDLNVAASNDPNLFLSALSQNGDQGSVTVATTIGDLGTLDLNFSSGVYTFTIINDNAESLVDDEVIVFNYSIGAFDSLTGDPLGIPDAFGTLTITIEADSFTVANLSNSVDDELGSIATGNIITESGALNFPENGPFSLTITGIDPSSSLFFVSSSMNGLTQLVFLGSNQLILPETSPPQSLPFLLIVNEDPSDPDFGQYVFTADPLDFGAAENLINNETAIFNYTIGIGPDQASGTLTVTTFADFPNASALNTVTFDDATNLISGGSGSVTDGIYSGNFIIDAGVTVANGTLSLIDLGFGTGQFVLPNSAGFDITAGPNPGEFQILDLSLPAGFQDVATYTITSTGAYTFTVDPNAAQLTTDQTYQLIFVVTSEPDDNDDSANGFINFTIQAPVTLMSFSSSFVADGETTDIITLTDNHPIFDIDSNLSTLQGSLLTQTGATTTSGTLWVDSITFDNTTYNLTSSNTTISTSDGSFIINNTGEFTFTPAAGLLDVNERDTLNFSFLESNGQPDNNQSADLTINIWGSPIINAVGFGNETLVGTNAEDNGFQLDLTQIAGQHDTIVNFENDPNGIGFDFLEFFGLPENSTLDQQIESLGSDGKEGTLVTFTPNGAAQGATLDLANIAFSGQTSIEQLIQNVTATTQHAQHAQAPHA